MRVGVTSMDPAPQLFCTIVIPTFNRAALLRKTLETVVAQEHGAFECVVVDDGGTDDSASVVAAFQDERLRYVWVENGERGAARNHGTRLARGRYVYFLDSDDQLTRDHLMHAEEVLRRLGWPEVLHSRFALIDEAGRRLSTQRYPRDLSRAMRRRNRVGSYLFVRTDAARAYPYIEDRRFNIGEDWLHALVLMARFPIHLTERVTRLVVMHPGQSMRSRRSDFERNRTLLRRYLAESGALDALGERTARYVDAEMESLIALQAALEGSVAATLKLQLHAVTLRPGLALEPRTPAVVRQALWQFLRRAVGKRP